MCVYVPLVLQIACQARSLFHGVIVQTRTRGSMFGVAYVFMCERVSMYAVLCLMVGGCTGRPAVDQIVQITAPNLEGGK